MLTLPNSKNYYKATVIKVAGAGGGGGRVLVTAYVNESQEGKKVQK